MKIEDQVVSLELAKRLKELGVRQESAFYWTHLPSRVNGFGPIKWLLKFVLDEQDKKYLDDEYGENFSAFTVAELGEMLPLWYYSKRIPDGSWSTDHVSRMDILNTNEKTEADSRAAMLIQLIERKIERL